MRLAILVVLLPLWACAASLDQDRMLAALGPAGPGGLVAGASAGTPRDLAIASRDPKQVRLSTVGSRVLAASAAFCAGTGEPYDPAKIEPGPGYHGEAPGRAGAVAKSPACDYPVVLSDGDGTNAFTNGRRIRVTRGLLRFATRDSELAFAIAHEVSHNLLHAGRGALAGDRKRMEYEADRLGLFLVARAGYSPKRAVGLLRRLSASRSGLERLNANYPTFSARFEALPDVIREIERKRSSGEALVPNLVKPRVAQSPVN